MSIAQFESFFKQYYGPLCARIARIVSDNDLAEDLVQDAFVKFYESKPDLDKPNSAPAYVSQIAVNNALMYLRKKQREDKGREGYQAFIPKTINQTENLINETHTEQSIQNVLQKLPPGCLRVFVLSRYEEMTYKEIAAQLDISVKTVENQISNALKILKANL
ncbi:MAG TPA: RNA polymerase sigma-70 factor [Cyclobacteriaceae bacterium]|jgi:RNA polymerase sigma-70 factor (ECF subfamily)|nr:RNA polymerase sigma-70 factor [Cyclobacteriaceae bacterium]